MLNSSTMISSLVYSLVGMVTFVFGFWLFDRLTPYKLWEEIVEHKNVALAIVVGAGAIALGLIIGSAIHG
jgi:uncharacterized membrane protein YjfL (UPF0719 family)